MSNIGNRIKQGTCVGGEEFNHSSLSLQSEPAIAVEAELGGGTGVGVGSNGPRPDDSLPASRSVAELEREPRGSDDYNARRERGQEGLHPKAYELAGRGSGRGREDVDEERVDQADPPLSESDIGSRIPTPSILQDGEPESM